jgi:L-iditol 2-dehydrogenase
MAPSLVETVSASQNTESLKAGPKLTVSPCCTPEVDGVSSTIEEMKLARNPSLQVTAAHTIKMADAPILRPEQGEVLLHIKATGICG